MSYDLERKGWGLNDRSAFIKDLSGFKDAKNRDMGLQVIHTG
jgi:hypothetical protein